MERSEFIGFIASNPEAGDVMAGSGRSPKSAMESLRHW